MQKPVFRMSSAGKCPRALSAEYIGLEAKPAPVWLAQAAEEGNWHEQRIVDQLSNDGHMVFDRQQEVGLEFPSFILVGHIDGKVSFNDMDKLPSPKLLEIKSMSQYEFDRWMRGKWAEFPEYAAQITCYMEATGLSEVYYLVKNRSSGYIDVDLFEGQPSNFKDIVTRLTDIANHVAGKQLVQAEFKPNSIQCKRCSYRDIVCLVTKEDMAKATEEELIVASDEYRRGIELVAYGTELVDKAKAKFKEHTIASEIDKWKFNNLAIG